jgi:hypothetical protein
MSKRTLIIAFFILLLVLHQDFWWRDNPALVFGILPISLAYHVAWTLLVAVAWFLVTKFCWPDALDETAAAKSEPTPKPQPDRLPR